MVVEVRGDVSLVWMVTRRGHEISRVLVAHVCLVCENSLKSVL